MGRSALELACRWVELCLSVETEISGRAVTNLYYVELGGLWWSNVLNSALPPWRLGLTPGWSTTTLSATRLRRKGRKKERKKFVNIKKIIIKKEESNPTNKQIHQ